MRFIEAKLCYVHHKFDIGNGWEYSGADDLEDEVPKKGYTVTVVQCDDCRRFEDDT